MTSTFRVGPGWISTSLVLFLAAWILRSFLVPLAWAVIIALATWPFYRRFSAYFPQRFAFNGIPLLFTALVTFFVATAIAMRCRAGSQRRLLLQEVAIPTCDKWRARHLLASAWW